MNSATDLGFTAKALIGNAHLTNQDILDAELDRARHALAYLKAKIGNDAMRELLADPAIGERIAADEAQFLDRESMRSYVVDECR